VLGGAAGSGTVHRAADHPSAASTELSVFGQC